jgi:hypothetical protein
MSLIESIDRHFNEIIKDRMVSEKDTFFLLLGPNEFHYCEPQTNEFKCKFGEAVIKRDALPEGFTLAKWKVTSVENEEQMLSAYDEFMSNREQ